MPLVGYDVNSSDDEDEAPAVSVKGKQKNGSEAPSQGLKLSKILPEPKGGTSLLGSTFSSNTSTGKKSSIRIRAPELPVLGDDDSDEELNSGPAKKKKFQGAGNDGRSRSGLFAKLPAPMNAAPTGRQSNTNFLPYVFTKPKRENNPDKKVGRTKGEKVPPLGNKTHIKDGQIEKNESVSTVPSIADIRKRSAEAAAKILSDRTSKPPIENDDSDDESSVGFFSYVEKIPEEDTPDSEFTEVDTKYCEYHPTDLAPEVPESTNQEKFDMDEYAMYTAPLEIQPDSAPTMGDMEEMLRLQGRRNRNETINFIDIHGDDALEGGREMLLKQISEEKSIERTSHKKTNVPGGIMKKKHQLPYLVQQAKAREVELKNAWAQGRLSKQQTQSKYGW